LSALPVYREYPKVLNHPHFQPAIVSDDSERGAWQTGYNAPAGRAAQFPPVTVNGPDQEEYYVSRGYTPGTTTAPEEWQRRMVAPRIGPQVDYPRFNPDGSVDYGPAGPPVVDKDYPKWVTLADGSQAIAQSAEHEAQLCPPREPTEAEIAAELAEIEAKAAALRAKLGRPDPRPEYPPAPPQFDGTPVIDAALRAERSGKDRLIADAAELGIKADRRWSERRLQAAIDERLAVSDPESVEA
jgi:hypothetical protein